jgi:Chromo (CHRromatin Organisation MOdifier) domain
MVEDPVDFGEADDGARLYRVRWLGYEASEYTWEPEEGLADAFIRRYWKTKRGTIRH